jgi:hypothetical protein
MPVIVRFPEQLFTVYSAVVDVVVSFRLDWGVDLGHAGVLFLFRRFCQERWNNL